MDTLEGTTQIGCFNQSLLMRKSKKRFPYIGTHWHEDDAIDTLLSSVKSHNGTITVQLIVSTKTFLTDIYDVGSNSGLNIAIFLQYRFHKRGIPINIWSDDAQEEFMVSLKKLLRTNGVGSNKFEAHK